MTAPLVITMLGDSLTAGYGLRPAQALPVRLEAALAGRGVEARVVNAGVSGDTSADGLRRMARAVPDETGLCIVALGANDLMQGVAPQRMEQTLDAILDGLQARAIPALLCGMKAPLWYGPYAWAYDAVFPAVAARHGAALHPFLLEGVALHPSYVLPDGIHPNAAGIERIAAGLAVTVARAIANLPESVTASP